MSRTTCGHATLGDWQKIVALTLLGREGHSGDALSCRSPYNRTLRAIGYPRRGCSVDHLGTEDDMSEGGLARVSLRMADICKQVRLSPEAVALRRDELNPRQYLDALRQAGAGRTRCGSWPLLCRNERRCGGPVNVRGRRRVLRRCRKPGRRLRPRRNGPPRRPTRTAAPVSRQRRRLAAAPWPAARPWPPTSARGASARPMRRPCRPRKGWPPPS